MQIHWNKMLVWQNHDCKYHKKIFSCHLWSDSYCYSETATYNYAMQFIWHLFYKSKDTFSHHKNNNKQKTTTMHCTLSNNQKTKNILSKFYLIKKDLFTNAIAMNFDKNSWKIISTMFHCGKWLNTIRSLLWLCSLLLVIVV